MVTNCHLRVHLGLRSGVRQATPRRRNAFVTALLAGFMPRPTTMLPFLYQTKTLANLSSIGRRPVCQYRYINVIGRRTFSRCEIRALTDGGKSTTDEATDESPLDPNKDTKEGTGRFSTGRFAHKHSTEPKKFSFSHQSSRESKTRRNDNGYTNRRADGMDAIRTDGTTTRQINNKGRDIKHLEELDIPWGDAAAEDLEFEEFDLDESKEEFDFEESNEEDDNIYQEADEIQNLTRRSGSRQDGTSTITPSERLAFQKIFSDIFSRPQPTTPYGMDGLLDEETTESSDEFKSRTAGARETVDKIVHSATQDVPREEIETAVNRYPPALRHAAARAMGLTSQKPRAVKATEADTASESEEMETLNKPSMDHDELEILRKPERDRVEGLMRSAKTDFELWTVMQKEVFSLISKLGLEQAPEEEETPSKKKRGKKTSRDQKVSPPDSMQQTRIALDSPVHDMLPLDFYGPLYPSYLLLGLRLLDRSFDRPSPLTLSILPEIKSLGIISHVLGGPTQLYNELLLIHWYRYDDFRGVLQLLNEMEQFGLDWNKETWDIINRIASLQKAVHNGDRGVALKALWTLPEFGPGRFIPWKNKIAQALAKRIS